MALLQIPISGPSSRASPHVRAPVHEVKSAKMATMLREETGRLIKVLDILLSSIYHMSYIGSWSGSSQALLQARAETMRGVPLQFVNMLIQHANLERSQSPSHHPSLISTESLRRSTSSLGKMLLQDTQLSQMLRDCFRPRSPDLKDFVELLANLREMTISNLTRIETADTSVNNLLEQASSKEHKENITARHVQEQIEIRRKAITETLDSKVKYIEALNRRLDQVNTQRNEAREKIADLSEKGVNEPLPYYQQKRTNLLTELAAARAKLTEQKEVNRGLEEKLHRRKLSGEGEIQKIIGEYDQRMTEVHGEVNRLRADYENNRERVRVLSQHFQQLDEARAAKADRDAREMRRRATLERNLRIWASAAILLQRYTARIRRSNKGKGKKGKGAKKAKK